MRAASGPTPVTSRQLGASLRSLAEKCLALGARNSWEPTPGSAAAYMWGDAPRSVEAETVTEAESHGVMLLRSGLEHALATAAAISGDKPFLPFTVGRSALEHSLRSHHFLDPSATPQERAVRRLNEWLHAVAESRRLRIGVQNSGHPGAETMDDEAAMLARIEARATRIGLAVTRGKTAKIEGSAGRPSTMRLSEMYLTAGGGEGVPATLFRTMSAYMHGLETGLLGSAVELRTSYPPMRFEPKPMDKGQLAFQLLCVPLAAVNATHAMRTRFEWPEDEAFGRLLTAQERFTSAWTDAVREHLDVLAPARPRTAVLGPIEPRPGQHRN